MGIDRLFDCVILLMNEFLINERSTINLLDLNVVDRSIDKCCSIFGTVSYRTFRRNEKKNSFWFCVDEI